MQHVFRTAHSNHQVLGRSAGVNANEPKFIERDGKFRAHFFAGEREREEEDKDGTTREELFATVQQSRKANDKGKSKGKGNVKEFARIVVIVITAAETGKTAEQRRGHGNVSKTEE